MTIHPLVRAAAASALLLAAACGDRDAGARPNARATADSAAGTPRDSASATASPATPGSNAQGDVRDNAPPQIRGLYINAYAAGSRTRLPQLLKIADETEVNAFVVDVKDEKGIRYNTSIALAKSLAQPGEVTIRDLKAFVDTLHAHRIYAIARIVVFKDPILSKAEPAWSVKQANGALWRDKKGNTWVSPWDPNVWNYNLQIAEEAARAGFDAIQFDYVRFAEPYRSLPPQVHPLAKGARSDAIAAFLNEAKRRLHPLGVMIQADVFGLVPNDPGDVDIGQQWETVASTADHVNPMMYPSHYLSSHLPGVPKPDLMPYQTIFKSAGMARIRNDRLREVGVTPARVLVWLQAFNATWLGRNHQDYGPQQLREQKQGVYDVGFEDWILWSPGSHYEQVAAGLERETVSRRKPQYAPPADVLATVNLFDRQGVRTAREKAARQARGQIADPAAAQAAKQGAPEPNTPPSRVTPGQNAPAEAAPKTGSGTR
ncbi:MAG: putative glycoside hydrolase [Longimicrobiaceae bacterium]